MWMYEQATGNLLHEATLVGKGYSGNGRGKNNPAMESVHYVGPIPRGFYIIGEPRDTEDHGPFVLPLSPNPVNEMYGRTGFLIHGDKLNAPPGNASEGCIILPHDVRTFVWRTGDKFLQVVSGLIV